jgi:hypothetical protein
MLTGFLLELAGSVAVPFIKKVLGEKITGVGGDLAGTVVDMIAEKVGVPAKSLPYAPPEAIKEAMVEIEPEVLALYNESQRMANELQQAEMAKDGPVWTWAWRPAGMWLFLVLTFHLVFLVPLINILLTSPLILVLDVPTFVTLFITYAGLYMGGHTAKSALESWRRK